MSSQPHKRVYLTDTQHMLLCKYYDENPGKTYKQLAQWAHVMFCLHKEPSLSSIMSHIKLHRQYKL